MNWLTRSALSALAHLAVRAFRARLPDFRGKTVIITGGSRGLGLELARCFAEEGARVALCARTEADVERAEKELARSGADVMGEVCDVTREDQVKRFIQSVLDRWGQIDVLVNNAGVIQAGPFSCMTKADYEEAMATHFWGPLHTVLAVLPHMWERRQGRIVNISSIGGKVSVPHLLPYCASKFALTSLSEGLHAELAKENIHVTTVCPGLMRTGSPRNAVFKGRHREEYAWFSISDSLPGLSIGSRRAARRIVAACKRGDAVITLSWPSFLATRLHGLFPGAVSTLMGLVAAVLPPPGGVLTERRKGSESTSRWSPSWLTALTQRAEVRNNELGDASPS